METTVNNYIVVIDDKHTLKSVRSTPESTSELDLSNLSLEFITKDAFVNLGNVRTLNLSKNSLFSLPGFVFASLASLEHLSLAENQLRRMANAFAGLKNLRTLDLTNNEMWYIEEGYFHGLTSSTEILLSGNEVYSISSLAFEKRPEPNEPSRERRRSSMDGETYYEEKAREARMYLDESERSTSEHASEVDSDDEYVPQIQILIVDGCVEVIEYLKKDETPPEGYIKGDVRSSYLYPTLYLAHRGIRSFQKGWYRLEHDDKRRKPTMCLDLSNNEIERVTSDFLDDLPPHVRHLGLSNNKIERLERGVFRDRSITILDLTKNLISEIEDGALQDLPLDVLSLAENRLRNTGFAATLPSTLTVLRLEDNEIVELTPGAFSKLNKVHTFRFHGNKLETLLRDSFQGLTSISELDLADQRLTKIEPGAFRGLDALKDIQINGNQLECLEREAFDGWTDCCFLNLKSNRLRLEALPEWPENLCVLNLGDNGIGDLKAGALVKWPVTDLELSGNGITRIEPGSFDLPKLSQLDLKCNPLGNFDGECFQGLPNLRDLCLYECGITRIEKGFMKHLGGLDSLNLRWNTIDRLDNGAFFGIKKSTEAIVTMTERYLQVMQGGVFDDA